MKKTVLTVGAALLAAGGAIGALFLRQRQTADARGDDTGVAAAAEDPNCVIAIVDGVDIPMAAAEPLRRHLSPSPSVPQAIRLAVDVAVAHRWATGTPRWTSPASAIASYAKLRTEAKQSAGERDALEQAERTMTLLREQFDVRRGPCFAPLHPREPHRN